MGLKSGSKEDFPVADIVAKGVCKEGTVQVGKTKVFMKNGAHIELEEAREESLYFVVTVMQKSVRGMLLRVASKRWKEIRQGLKAAIASRNIDQLKEWLEKSSELPGRGTHLAEVKGAHTLKERILAEQRCVAMLTQAIEGQEIPSLEEAVRSATEMNLDTPEGAAKVKEATDLIAHLNLCKATVEELRAAIAAVSYDDVCRLLTKCGELGLNNDEMLQGEALKKRIEEERRIIDALTAAIASRDLEALVANLAEASSLGIENDAIDAAEKVRDAIQAEIAATKQVRCSFLFCLLLFFCLLILFFCLLYLFDRLEQLVAAVESNDLDIVAPAVAHAKSISLPDCPELAAALALEAKLTKEKAAIEAVQAAIEAREAGAIKAAVAGAEACGLDAAGTPALQAAADLVARLAKEAEAIKAVVAATKSKDGMALAQALAECSELELSGAEVDAANTLMEKLGKKVQLEAEVMKAASGFDIAAIEAAVAAAKKGGVADDSQGLKVRCSFLFCVCHSVVLIVLFAPNSFSFASSRRRRTVLSASKSRRS